MKSEDFPGPRSRELAAKLRELECPAFGARRERRAELAGAPEPCPIVLARGEGSYLWDVDGRRYLDLAAGFGAVLLGHGAEAIAAAIAAQSARLLQGLGDVYASDVKIELLEALAALHPSGQGQVLLCGSGGDAVSAAIKTATLATGRPGLIAFDGAYHGLGYGPLAACGFRTSFREPFATQLNPHVRFAPYPGVRGASADAALEWVTQHLKHGDVAAVLVEPVIGRGGCVVPPAGFLAELGFLAHAHGALLVADEVWTGLGRAGALVRSSEDGASADLVCFGKGLGGGLPISACVGSRAVMAAWAHGGEVVHTSTHAGLPLGCAAALATLRTVREQRLAERAVRVGDGWRRTLAERVARSVRGAGLLVGVELSGAEEAQRAAAALLSRGYLVVTGGVAGDTLTLSPPLTVEEHALTAFADCLAEVVPA